MAKLTRRERIRKKHLSVRKKIFGTPERPRLCVYRSLKHIYAQLIDDKNGVTICSASTVDKDLKGSIKYGGNVDAAKIVGATIAKKAIEKGIKEVVFDRNGFIYHGRIKALAEAAREAGLKF